MRVLMLPVRFYPFGDGTERQARALSRTLRARAVDVAVATARFRGLAPAQLVDGIPVRRLPYVPDRHGLRRLAKYSYLAALGAYLLREGRSFDVFHCHMASYQVIPAVLAGQALKHPVLVKVACAGWDGDVERLRRGVVGGELGPLAAHLLRHAIAVAPSREIERELRAQGYRHVQYIPNGVDTQRFHPAAPEERRHARSRLALPPERLLVGFMGRLESQKAVDVLIGAWLRTSLVRTGALLCVAGEGPLQPDLRAIAAGHPLSGTIRFLGHVEAVEFLRALDAFALPSRYEGMPNALLEAMASGPPVVGTRIGGTEDLVEHGQTGLLVGVDDVGHLAAALDHLADPTTRQRLGRAARDRVETAFSLDAVAGHYEELYQSVARGTSPLATEPTARPAAADARSR
jgi:glycosyltransferase involved in cell wall biosynthesis